MTIAANHADTFLGCAGLYEVRRNEYGVFMEVRFGSTEALARGKAHEIVWVPEDVFEEYDWANKDALAALIGCDPAELEALAAGGAVERARLTLWIAEYWGLDNIL